MQHKFILMSLIATASMSAEEPSASCPIQEPNLIGHHQIQDGYGITISGSAMYWQPKENGLDFVIKNDGAVGVNNNGQVKQIPFDWSWGGKVELDYQVPKKMDIGLSWTYLSSHGKTTVSATLPETLFSTWSIPTGSSISPVAREQLARAHANLKLNLIDLGIGTTFSPRPFLDITPFIDLSSAWIHQHFHLILSGGPGLNGSTTLDDSIHLKNNFWGIGPKIGLNTLWNLGYGFGICGNFNGSLLYGLFEISQSERTTFIGLSPATNYLDISQNTFHLATFNLDFFLGLRWDHMFCNNRYHLLLEAGWENLLFFNQNQLMRFPSQVNAGLNSSQKGDLSMQGGTVRAAFTF